MSAAKSAAAVPTDDQIVTVMAKWCRSTSADTGIAEMRALFSPAQAAAVPEAAEQLKTALRRLLREYIFTRTMDGTTAEDCETMECVRAARAATANYPGAAS